MPLREERRIRRPTAIHHAIGLCPGDHTDEFFMPDPKISDTCPHCGCLLVIYTRPSASDRPLLCEECSES